MANLSIVRNGTAYTAVHAEAGKGLQKVDSLFQLRCCAVLLHSTPLTAILLSLFVLCSSHWIQKFICLILFFPCFFQKRNYDIATTNIAGLGTDLEKKVRAAAAATESQWNNAGKVPGIQVWRIEQFKVHIGRKISLITAPNAD